MRLVICLICLFLSGSILAQNSGPDWAAVEVETLRHFRALLQFDTSDPPGRELPAADYLRQVLEAEGFEVEILATDPERPNVLTRLRGNGDKQPLLIMAHTDVVNVDPDKWKFPPFSATVRVIMLWTNSSSFRDINLRGTADWLVTTILTNPCRVNLFMASRLPGKNSNSSLLFM